MTDDDFSNHHTMGEIKSDKTGRSQDWTVREMLVSILRCIDAGEISPRMGSVVLGYGGDTEQQVTHILYAGTRSIWEQSGLHARAMQGE